VKSNNNRQSDISFRFCRPCSAGLHWSYQFVTWIDYKWLHSSCSTNA